MGSFGHRKQILLFLAAVIVPSLVLVLLTLRIVRQEKELAEKRVVQERQRRATEIGQHLLIRLEKIKLEEANKPGPPLVKLARSGYKNPEVAFLALVNEGRLVLPWEYDPALNESSRLLNRPDFSQKIRQAEKAEFEQKDPPLAAKIYRQVLMEAKDGVQREYARLLLARALAKSEKTDEALSHYRIILALPSQIADESGIPLYLYAAERLLGSATSLPDVANRISTAMEEGRWLSPIEAHMINSLLRTLAESFPDPLFLDKVKTYQNKILLTIQELEKILALQRNFQRYMFMLEGEEQKHENDPIWTANADGSWLLGITSPRAETEALLVVVEVPSVLASLRRDKGFTQAYPEEFRLVAGESPEGASIGPNFQGLKIVFQPAGSGTSSDKLSFPLPFYLILVILVLTLTSFGAYLLWRDVRRDLNMAEMRSQFVSSVSHELKTPLTAIRMFAETLRLGRSKNPKTQEEYLDTIVNESERLSRLLNNVLDFSKIEQGKKAYRAEPTSLYDVIRASAQAMEYPLSQKGFALRLDTEEGLPDVRVDKDALEQAILNLLSNAVKYSRDSREIELGLKRKDDWALIQVSDHGVGIDPREQKRIFEKFYRVASAENERIPGTGLGLALVSHFVKAHGGVVEVKSAPGQGSTFSIYLPLERQA